MCSLIGPDAPLILLPPCTCLTLPCSALESVLAMFNYDKGITPCDELLHLVSDLCNAMNAFHCVNSFFFPH